MEITSSIVNNVKVLGVTGNFDIYTAAPIRTWLEQNLTGPAANIIIDLSSVNFIDSTALAILMRGFKRAREINGNIRLCGLQPPVHMVLELTRLDNVFEIFPSLDKALVGF